MGGFAPVREYQVLGQTVVRVMEDPTVRRHGHDPVERVDKRLRIRPGCSDVKELLRMSRALVRDTGMTTRSALTKPVGSPSELSDLKKPDWRCH